MKMQKQTYFRPHPALRTARLPRRAAVQTDRHKSLDARGKARYSSVSRGVRIAVPFARCVMRVPGAAAPPAVRPL